jgi:hypothetical protein
MDFIFWGLMREGDENKTAVLRSFTSIKLLQNMFQSLTSAVADGGVRPKKDTGLVGGQGRGGTIARTIPASIFLQSKNGYLLYLHHCERWA